MERLGRSGEYDCVLAVSSAHPPAHTGARVEALLAMACPVPVVHLWMAGDVAENGLARRRAAGEPVVCEPQAAVRALAALIDGARPSDDPPAAPPEAEPPAGADLLRHRACCGVPLRAEPPAGGDLSEQAAKEVVRSWGLAVVEGRTAAGAEDHATPPGSPN